MSKWLVQARPRDAEDSVEAPWVTFAIANSPEGAERCLERASKMFPQFDDFEWQKLEVEPDKATRGQIAGEQIERRDDGRDPG